MITLYNIPSWKAKKSMLYYSQGKGDTDEKVKATDLEVSNLNPKQKVAHHNLKQSENH